MGEGEDGVVLSLEGSFDFCEIRSRSNGRTDLVDGDTVGSKTVGEAVSSWLEISRVRAERRKDATDESPK